MIKPPRARNTQIISIASPAHLQQNLITNTQRAVTGTEVVLVLVVGILCAAVAIWLGT